MSQGFATPEVTLVGFLNPDGSVPLTADWDAGSFKITAEQFESDVAGGTAPFIVASNTVVSNLNADLLDGNEAAAFLTSLSGAVLVDGSAPLTANWDVGAFTITGTRFISDIATGTSPFGVSSTTVVTNLNADTVDAIEGAEILQRDGSIPLTGDWNVGSFDLTAVDITSSGLLTFGGTIGSDSIITPTAFSGNTDDWSPTGLSTATIVRFSTGSSAYILTGMAAQAAGRLLWLVNVDSGGYMRFDHESGSSSAVNRFRLPNGAAVRIREYSSALMFYDGTLSRWVMLSWATEHSV